jgi:sterol desaturase/sphingolipid hydroxylase (fatty acid hydroxylase superfamily)
MESFAKNLWTPSADIPGPLSRPIVQIFFLLIALAIALSWWDKPTFLPSMITSYIIAAGFCFYQYKKHGQHKDGVFRALFPRDVWFHRSTVHDFIITIITFVLMSHVLHFIVLDPNGPLDLIYGILQRIAPVEGNDAVPPWPAVALYVVLALTVSDFFYYVSHRLTHEIPVLWEFHKVHHSAEVLTPLTVYRLHPLDSWFNQCFRNFGVGLVSGFFYYFYPSNFSILAITSTVVGIYLFHLAMANLRHSHIWISFGPVIERFIISPAQHQIHHSTNPKHFDKNYGSTLALWDWMFGSIYIPKGKEEIRFGLGDDPHDKEIHSSLWKMYVHPVKNFVKWVIG